MTTACSLEGIRQFCLSASVGEESDFSVGEAVEQDSASSFASFSARFCSSVREACRSVSSSLAIFAASSVAFLAATRFAAASSRSWRTRRTRRCAAIRRRRRP